MTLREIESSLSQLVVALHDLARATANPGVASRLRDLAHEVSLLADQTRRLLIALP